MNVKTIAMIAGFSGLLLSEAETAADAAAAANVVKDGDFSMKQTAPRTFGRWGANLPEGCKVSHDTADFKSAPQSLCLESSGKTIAVRQNLPDLKPDTKYKVTFFMKMENIVPTAKPAGARLNICSDRNHWSPAKFLTGTQPWTPYELVFTSGAGTNGKVKSYILLYLMNASGKVWFDDIRLEEVK